MIYARRIIGSLFLLAAAAYGIFPQGPKKGTDPVPGQELQNIINETYPLDAEYAIDILLKIVRSGKLPDGKWQKRLVIESYRRLDDVQQPTRQRLILAAIEVDNRQVRLSEAFEKKLDALSLRGEILRQTLKADPREARRIAFETGFVPGARTLSCEDALSDDFGPFYEIIADIARTSFSPAEIKGQARLLALLPFIESMTTLSQIAPVGKMIVSIDAGKEELNTLLFAYGSAIKGMRPSDREFSGFLWSYDWVREFMSVLKVCEGQGIQCSFLKDTLGGFIVRNFRSERCADNRETYREYAPGLIKYLNSALFRGAPIKADDLKPASIGVPAKLDPYGESTGAKRINEKYRTLNWRNTPGGEVEFSAEEKRAPEWLEKFERLFDEVEEWNGDGEKSPAAYFHQKCIFYTMLYEAAPPGSFPAKVLRAFGNFLIKDPTKKESRIEWFLWIGNYMAIVEENPNLRLELLENSKDPVIRLYTAFKDPAPSENR